MNLYQITNKRTGANHLTWAAASPEDALENMAREACFEDFAAWCADGPTPPDEIVVTEIDAPWAARTNDSKVPT